MAGGLYGLTDWLVGVQVDCLAGELEAGRACGLTDWLVGVWLHWPAGSLVAEVMWVN